MKNIFSCDFEVLYYYHRQMFQDFFIDEGVSNSKYSILTMIIIINCLYLALPLAKFLKIILCFVIINFSY